MDSTELTERELFGGYTVEGRAPTVNFMRVVSVVVLTWRILEVRLKL
jgi:hypothetical protein